MLTNNDFYHIKQYNHNTDCVKILKQLFNKTSLNLAFDVYMQTNHSLLNNYFNFHNYNSQAQKAIRGRVNEFLILLYFYHHGITHLYPQAYLFFIPDIKFDLVLFTKNKRIIAFNFKTCLRDRYKQAIVEAQQIKKFDTRFQFFLLTNNTIEAKRVNQKIIQGKITGINEVIDCFSPSANHFLKTLLTNQFLPFSDINMIKNKERNTKYATIN